MTSLATMGAVAGLAISGGAHASITPIAGGGQGGTEPSVWAVLNALVGNGASLTQADVNAGGENLGGVAGLSRVDDDVDQFYRDGNAPISVIGLFYDNPNMGDPFGGAAHSLYYENESTGAAAIQLTNGGVGLRQINVGPNELYSLTAVRGGLDFDGSQNGVLANIASSIASENVASGVTSTDRMVTFAIDIEEIPVLTALDGSIIELASRSNSGSGRAYVHFFDTGSDADYQDAIYLTVGARAIPTPGGLGLLGGAGLAAMRRKRK